MQPNFGKRVWPNDANSEFSGEELLLDEEFDEFETVDLLLCVERLLKFADTTRI